MAPQTDATNEPLPDIADERQAIRDALDGENIHILTFYGNEEMVALVQRDKRPPTEFHNEGETIVLIEWPENEDYGVSKAEGINSNQWELTEELVEIVETREEATDVAREIFNND